MRSTPELDAWLRERLKAAVDTFAGGSVDKLGRMLDYANGGYIREILNGKKPVREAILERARSVKEMASWFDHPDVAVPVAAPPPEEGHKDELHRRLMVAFDHILATDKAKFLSLLEARAAELREIGRQMYGIDPPPAGPPTMPTDLPSSVTPIWTAAAAKADEEAGRQVDEALKAMEKRVSKLRRPREQIGWVVGPKTAQRSGKGGGAATKKPGGKTK